MGASPKQLANRKLLAPSGAQSALIRSRSSYRVTGSFVRLERWGIMAADRFANARWSDGNSHRGIQSAGVQLIESGLRRLNGQPKIDIALAANIVSVTAYVWRKFLSITPVSATNTSGADCGGPISIPTRSN